MHKQLIVCAQTIVRQPYPKNEEKEAKGEKGKERKETKRKLVLQSAAGNFSSFAAFVKILFLDLCLLSILGYPRPNAGPLLPLLLGDSGPSFPRPPQLTESGTS